MDEFFFSSSKFVTHDWTSRTNYFCVSIRWNLKGEKNIIFFWHKFIFLSLSFRERERERRKKVNFSSPLFILLAIKPIPIVYFTFVSNHSHYYYTGFFSKNENYIIIIKGFCLFELFFYFIFLLRHISGKREKREREKKKDFINI